jgi:transcriptional regulator with XRE-family HTH domain
VTRDHHLRERREALGLSQQAVAIAAGLRWPAVVSNLELRKLNGMQSGPVVERKIRAAIVRAERAAGRGTRRPWRQARPVDPAEATRALAAAVPASPERDALFKAMEERIIALWDQHRFEEGDYILEFLPDAIVTRILDEYFDWMTEGK